MLLKSLLVFNSIFWHMHPRYILLRKLLHFADVNQKNVALGLSAGKENMPSSDLWVAETSIHTAPTFTDSEIASNTSSMSLQSGS